MNGSLDSFRKKNYSLEPVKSKLWAPKNHARSSILLINKSLMKTTLYKASNKRPWVSVPCSRHWWEQSTSSKAFGDRKWHLLRTTKVPNVVLQPSFWGKASIKPHAVEGAQTGNKHSHKAGPLEQCNRNLLWMPISDTEPSWHLPGPWTNKARVDLQLCHPTPDSERHSLHMLPNRLSWP